MGERKLAHVEIIESLSPIAGADRIEKAVILGWQCIVKRGEFNVGERVIYVEVDSCMPETPDYEFLRDRKFRIKTIKLKGEISQGLVLPCSQYAEVGADYTDFLGITKYLSPSERDELSQEEKKISNEKNKLKKFMMRYSWFRRLFLPRKQVVGFPYWVSKTDEERIQNIPQVLDDFKDSFVYVTEKIDYQSGTWTGKMVSNTTPLIGKFLPKKFKFVVCSRNLMNNNKDSLYWKIAEKYNIEKILKKHPTLTIQGEQGDTKVQGNKYAIREPQMWVFNIYDHEKNWHYSFGEMSDFCERYGLTTVPLIGFYKLGDITPTVNDMIEFSKGKSVVNKKINREGVVVRIIKNGKKLLSFKAINPDFLLNYSE